MDNAKWTQILVAEKSDSFKISQRLWYEKQSIKQICWSIVFLVY